MDWDQVGLADLTRRIRKQKNLNQAKIRERGGPSSGWLGELEAGTLTSVPKPATLRRLANALGVPAREVFDAAGIEPVTLEDRGVYVLRNQEAREKFLELAFEQEFPPTPEEVALIRSLPDLGENEIRGFSVEIFRTPESDRAWFIDSLNDWAAKKKAFSEYSKGLVRLDLQTQKTLEIMGDLTPEDREEMLEYAKMRLRKLQAKRKADPR